MRFSGTGSNLRCFRESIPNITNFSTIYPGHRYPEHKIYIYIYRVRLKKYTPNHFCYNFKTSQKYSSKLCRLSKQPIPNNSAKFQVKICIHGHSVKIFVHRPLKFNVFLIISSRAFIFNNQFYHRPIFNLFK